MAQPPTYDRQFSFTNYQALHPSTPLPAVSLELELNTAKETLDAVLTNLALIQRDDGALANDSVGLDQLTAEVLVGFEVPTVWVTATAYTTSNTVFHGSAFYRCLIAHTSGTFATDLTALKWQLIVDLSTIATVSATQVAVTPAGGISATTVAAAINELDAEKAALSHTHLSSAITDSTAAGRNMLAAATTTAQRALLSLGALALLDTIAVTDITANVALTGDITPAALLTTTNDWAPTGWATAAVVKASAAVDVNVTGLAATTDGDIKIIDNVSTAGSMTFIARSASSALANRLLLTTAHKLRPLQSSVWRYDGTSSPVGWRLLQSVSPQPVAGGYKQLTIDAGNTPNAQVSVVADAITLEEAYGGVYRAKTVSVQADINAAGANGLDAGAGAANTWYAIWVIYNPATDTVAALLSTSATAPTLPSGYTHKARVGWNRTDGSGFFYRVKQFGRRAWYLVLGSGTMAAMPALTTGAAGSISVPTWVAVSVAGAAPSTACAVQLVTYANGIGLAVAPNSSYGAYNNGAAPPVQLQNSASASENAVELQLETTNIYWGNNGSGGALFIRGWEDNI